MAESGVTTHNFPAATSSGDAGADATTDLFNSTQLIPTIVVQFVVLELDQTSDTWIVPETQTFHDMLSALECDMVNRDADFQNVIKWNNQWASIGIIGLSVRNQYALGVFPISAQPLTLSARII